MDILSLLEKIIFSTMDENCLLWRKESKTGHVKIVFHTRKKSCTP